MSVSERLKLQLLNQPTRRYAWPRSHENVVAALVCTAGEVTLTVDQIPFSGELGISLWDEQGRSTEHALLVAFGSDGNFKWIGFNDDGTEARFEFVGQTAGRPDVWHLAVAAKPRWALPWMGGVTGVIRSFNAGGGWRLRRRFCLRRGAPPALS